MVTPQAPATGPCCSVSVRDQMLADIHLLFRGGEIKRTLSELWSWIFMKRCEEVGLVVIDNCALDSGDHGAVTIIPADQARVARVRSVGTQSNWRHPPCLCPPAPVSVCLSLSSLLPAATAIVTTQFLCPRLAMARRSSQAKPRLVFNCNCKVSRRLGTQQAIPSVPS